MSSDADMVPIAGIASRLGLSNRRAQSIVHHAKPRHEDPGPAEASKRSRVAYCWADLLAALADQARRSEVAE